MARFRHSVLLEPVQRDWFEENVGLGHDILADHLGTMTPTAGEHLAPGTRYTTDKATITIDSWQRRVETAGRLTLTDDQMTMAVTARLVSAAAPRVAELAGNLRTTMPRGLGRLGRFHGTVRVDLERWWHGTNWADDQPAIEGRVKHTLGRATFAIRPSAGPDGRWRVTVSGRVRAWGLLSPLVAIGLVVARAKLRKGFVDGVNEFAARWNDEVPALVATTPDDLRARLLAELP